MKFGKQIQSQQIPGWGAYYLDYKALKKIISSLASSQLSSTSAVRPNDLFKLANPTPPQPASNPQPQTGSDPADLPEGFSATDLSLYPGQEHDPPGADSVFHAHKAAFFFKLERELEKARPITSTIINSFYLLKEGELKLRLATLLSKRKTAAKRLGAQQSNEPGVGEANGVEWRAVHEGFRLLERDLSKLQNFIELNATGFRKILKKWDKRSKSRTKELYLARQVEVQPVFNRELIAELSDTVAACLLDLTNVAVDDLDIHPGTGSGDLMLTQHIALSRAAHSSAILDLEGNLSKAVNTPEPNEPQIQQLLLLAQEATATSDKNHIVRILWKATIEAPQVVSDLIMTSPAFDIQAVDDISGRTFLHEAALSGQLRLVEIALVRGVDPAKIDVYARSALHYAALKGHADVCRALVASGSPSDALDMDNFSPLVHATVNGHLECCRTLLVDGRVNPMSAQAGQDLAPLSLACKHGHKEVVLLLLAHGAASQPNTNGELPLHLAVQEGHAEICRLLLRDPHQDVPDKYNEWTPLFHAARYGHLECVRLLLEAGHNPAAADDVGRQPIHYAAWFGHTDCMHALALAVQSVQNTISKVKTLPSISPASDLDTALDFDLDAEPIPTLSLPPPIMPFRVYGHNYLDHNYLVQIALGCPWTSHDNKVLRPVAGVELVPRLQGMSSKALPQSNPSLKLVATSNFSATDSSFNVVLPLSDDQDMFSFQVRGLHNLTLEFSVYPSFGSKAIGRGVALSHSFTELQGTGKMILPILDHRLHLIGQVSFDVCIITPFSSPGFDLGSKFETYWKSSTAPLNSNTLASTKQPASRVGLSGGPSSIHASPALNVSGNTIAGGTVITSSLTGEFVHLVVQVTRDLVPVVYAQSRLPVHGFDLSIGNVTYAQFSGLAQGDTPVGRSVSAVSDWHVALSSSFCSLERALQVLPMTLGVCIELAWAPESNRRVSQTLNAVVDSVLRAVYAAAYPNQAEDPQPSRRKLVLTSFNPFVCTALNWKQPNYPVFFSSYCGMLPRESHDAEASIETAVGDLRQRSISGAVDFARENNLLGVLVDARLIRQVPSIAQAVRDSNILLGSFGLPDQVTASLPVGPDTEPLNLDATLTQGVLTVHEYFPSANQL